MPPVVAPKLRRRKAGVEPGFHQSNVTGQIVQNRGKRLGGGTLGDTTTGTSEGGKPTLTGTPPMFVEGPRPPAVGPELTRPQEDRFARLKNRKELGRGYNEDRFAKLLAIKKGAGKAIPTPTTGPAGATGPTGPATTPTTPTTPTQEAPLPGATPFFTPVTSENANFFNNPNNNVLTPADPYQSRMNDKRMSRLERLLSRKEAGKNYNENRLEKLQGFTKQDKQFSKFMDKLGEYEKWGQLYGGPGQTSAGAATYEWYKNLTPEQQAQVAGLMWANKGQFTQVAGGVGHPGEIDVFGQGGPASMGNLMTSSFPGLNEAYVLGLPDTNWYKDPVTGELKFDYAGEMHKEKKAAGAYSPGGAPPGSEYGPPLGQQSAIMGNPAVQQANAALQEFEKSKGFLPMTPEFEAQRRQLEDQLASALMSIGVARDQIPYYVNMMSQRMNTDEGYATQALNESMTDRGILGSSIVPWTQTRDVGIPFGRQRQDLALGAAQQYGDLATAQGEAYNTYYNQLMEALLGRAGQVSSQMPLSVPQYKPRKQGKTKPGKNKPGTKPRGRR